MEEIIKKITIDTSKSEQNLEKLDKKLDDVKGGIKEVNKESSSGGKGMEALTNGLKGFAKAGTVVASTAGGVTAAMQLMGVENEEVIKQIQKLQQFSAVAGMFNSFANDMPDMIKGFKGLTTGIKGASVGLSGFKKALIATGFGALVVVLGSIIANFDKIKEVIPTDSFNKFSDTLSGVWSVVKSFGGVVVDYIVLPFKNALITLKGLGKIIKAFFDGNFSEIGDIAKETGEEIKNNFVEMGESALEFGENIGENYNKGIEESRKERKAKEEAARQEELKNKQEAWAKERQELEKHLAAEKALEESKHNDEWKYTEEGKKYYDNYYKTRLSWYSKNSDDYKNILAEKNKYDREYADKLSELDEEERQRRKEAEENALNQHNSYLNKMYNLERDVRRKKQTDEQNEVEDAETKYNTELEAFKKLLNDKYISEEEYNKALALLEEQKQMALKDISDKYHPEEEGEEVTPEGRLQQVRDMLTELTDYASSIGDVIGEAWSSAFSGINSILGSLQDNLKVLGDESASFGDKAAAGAQVAGAAFGAVSNVLSSLAKEEDANTKEGFEKQKKLAIGAATFQMLQGIVTAMSGAMTTKSGPWDIALAAAQATAIGVMGAVQIAKIKQQKFEGGGGSSSASASIPSVNTSSVSDLNSSVQNSRTVLGDQEQESILGSQKVYVTETDITNTTKNVKTQVSENTI